MIFAKPTPAERARGCCFYTELESPAAIAAQGGTVTGVLGFQDRARGPYFNGDYLTYPLNTQPVSSGFWSLVLEFAPDFAANENAVRYFLDTDGAGTSVYHGNTAGNNALVVKTGASTTILTVLLADYTAYWKLNQRNTLVVTARTGANEVYLNGTLIGTSATVWTAQTQTTLYVGATNAGASTFLGSIRSLRWFRHNVAAELLTLQEATDYYVNQTFNYQQRAICTLPLTAETHDPGHALQTNDVDQTQLLVDGSMEAVGIAAWTVAGAGAVVQKTAGTRPGGTGTQVLQITRAGATASATQTILTVGQRYRVTGWARGDGVASWPRLIGTVALWSGTTSTTWQYCDLTFTAAGTSLGLWNHTDDGNVQFDDFTVQLSAGLLSDGAMEQGDADQWTLGNAAVLTKSLTTPQAGLRCLRVAYGGVNDPYAMQTIMTVGKRYHCEGYARGDTVRVPTVQDGATVLWTGTAAATWQWFSVDFTAATTGVRFQSSAVAAGYCEFDTCWVSEMAARTLDASGHGNALLLGDGTTPATLPTKLSQRGYSLDGGDYFKRETPLGISADFSVALVVRPTSSVGTRALWSCRNSALGKSLAVYGTAGAETLTILHNVGAATILTPVPLPLGAASHYCFVYTNGTRVMQIYYNGTLAYTSVALTDTNGHDNGFWVGALPTPEYYWLGSILSVDLLAFAATPMQIQDHYRQSLARLGAT
jgi:hypothetical protein